jgi:hypothetical protein
MSERAAYWRQVLGEWQASGLTQAEFCRRRGIKAVTFAWWKRRLRGSAGALPAAQAGSAPPAGRPAFVELALPTHQAGYELALPGGACLHLPADFDAERVARFVRALTADGYGGQATC